MGIVSCSSSSAALSRIVAIGPIMPGVRGDGGAHALDRHHDEQHRTECAENRIQEHEPNDFRRDERIQWACAE